MTEPRFYLDVQTEVPLKDLVDAFWELSPSEQLEVLRALIDESSFSLDDLVEELRG